MNEPKWARAFVETHLLSASPELFLVARDQYWSVVASWRLDREQHSARYDADRFARLLDLTDERLAQVSSRHDRRLLFNVTRAMRPSEILRLLALDGSDVELLNSLLPITTRSIVLYGQRRRSVRHASGSYVPMKSHQSRRLNRHLPGDIARLYALALLRMNAEVGFRCAAKGLRLTSRPGTETAQDRFVPPGWRFQPDQRLEQAIADYDRRRKNAAGNVSGLAAAEEWESADWYWPAPGFCSVPVHIEYPALDVSHTTRSYMVLPMDATRRLEQIQAFPDEFAEIFGLPPQPFADMCRTLAEAIWYQCGYWELRPVEDRRAAPAVDGLRFVSSLGAEDPRRQSASGYLKDVLEEGVLRAPRSEWHAILSQALPEEDQAGTLVDSFIDAFTSTVQRDPRYLAPVLFHDLEEHSLVLDLTLFGEFFDLCLHGATAPLSDKVRSSLSGGRRGKRFEGQAVDILKDRLSLTDEHIPLPPNYELQSSGVVENEVDFCFVVGRTLVHLDMKSRRRNEPYHRGEYNAVRNEQSELEKVFRKTVDPRGHRLLRLLRDRGHQLDRVVNLLCVADVKFIAPERANLWYGKTPRVLTPEEIAELVKDPQRWSEVTRLAERADHASPASSS